MHEGRVDLSFNRCAEVTSRMGEKLFPFGRLNGIGQLLEYIDMQRSPSHYLITVLKLNGHAFEAFEYQMMSNPRLGSYRITDIDLSDNYISNLMPDIFYNQNSGCYAYVNLSDNPITMVQDHLFDVIRHLRGQRRMVRINAAGSRLTEQQKDSIKRKWTLATHTIPERYFDKTVVEYKGSGVLWVGGLPLMYLLAKLSHTNLEHDACEYRLKRIVWSDEDHRSQLAL